MLIPKVIRKFNKWGQPIKCTCSNLLFVETEYKGSYVHHCTACGMYCGHKKTSSIVPKLEQRHEKTRGKHPFS